MSAWQTTQPDERQRELADLLVSLRPALERLGYPGADTIWPRVGYETWWSRYPRLHSLGKIKAWPIGTRFLGVDGTIYRGEGGNGGGWELTPLAELDKKDNFVETATLYLRRLVREVAPVSAPAERFDLFGATFQIAPGFAPRSVVGDLEAQGISRDVPNVPYAGRPPLAAGHARALDKELRCDDPAAGASVPCPYPSSPLPSSTRERQIRYSLLSWLRLITATGYRDLSAHPTMFLKPQSPYANGGPIHVEEVVTLIQQITDSGWAEWADPYTSRNPPWHLVLTERGVREADELHGAHASPARTRKLLTALLSWTGEYAKEPNAITLQLFLSAPECEIAGMIASVTETYRAARWLVNRGYLSRSFNCLPTTDSNPVMVSATREGLMCVDSYEGDPIAMREAQRRGDDRSSLHFEAVGSVAINSHHFTQSAGDVGAQSIDIIDIAELVRFAQAVSQALPDLNLDPSSQRAAETAASEIIAAAETREPDHPKLAALGRSLRAILEGAVTNFLTSVLLEIWKG